MEEQVRFKTFEQIEDAIDTLPIERLVNRCIDFTQCLNSVKVFWENPIDLDSGMYLDNEKLSSHFLNVSVYITNGEDLLYYMCKWYQVMKDRYDMCIDGSRDIMKFYRDVYFATNKAFKVIYDKVTRMIGVRKANQIICKLLPYPAYCLVPFPLREPDTWDNEPDTWEPASWETHDLQLPQGETTTQQQETTSNAKEEYSYINKEDATKLGLYKVLLVDCEKAEIITKSQDGRYTWNKQKNQFVLFCALLQFNELLENNQEIQWVEILQDFICNFSTSDLSSTRQRLHTMSGPTLHEIDSIFSTNGLKTKDFRVEKRNNEN